jgi:transcriptional regulator with XRE-family HTH domain
MGGAKSDDLPGIGARLREARESAGLSQAQAARLMDLHRPAITEMENETRKVTAGELRNLARFYKVSVEWLAGEPLDKAGRVKMAARKLSALSEKDLKSVIRIVDSLGRQSTPERSEPE